MDINTGRNRIVLGCRGMDDVERKPRKKLATPRKPGGDASKRPTLTFRVGKELSEKLRVNAEKSQTSISEEIERRLIASFSEIEDAQTEAVISLIAANFKAIQSVMDESWVKDPKIQIMCAKAAETTILTFGSMLNIDDADFNITRETNRSIGEKGGIAFSVGAIENLKHPGSEIAKLAARIAHDIAVDHLEDRQRGRSALAAALMQAVEIGNGTTTEPQEKIAPEADEKTMEGAAGQSLPPFMARLAGQSPQSTEAVLQKPETAGFPPSVRPRRKAKASAKV